MRGRYEVSQTPAEFGSHQCATWVRWCYRSCDVIGKTVAALRKNALVLCFAVDHFSFGGLMHARPATSTHR